MHDKRRKRAATEGDRQAVKAKTEGLGGCCQMEKGTPVGGY